MEKTIKERCKELREAFPDMGLKTIARTIGCDRNTVKFHLLPEYRAKQISKNSANNKQKVSRVKFILIQFLGGQCMKCGYRSCLDALDFHHRNESQKVADVSDLLSGKFENALEEAKKCDLLCANCHREQHAGNSN